MPASRTRHADERRRADELSLRDRPIDLVDIARSSGSRPTSSAWVMPLSGPGGTISRSIRESLSYARAILAADVAILSQPATQGTTGGADGGRRAPWTSSWLEPRRGPVAVRSPVIGRLDDLESGRRREASSSVRTTSWPPTGRWPGWICPRRPPRPASWGWSRSSWPILTERQAAVEARLQQIRAAIIRRYRRAAASSPRPARLSRRPSDRQPAAGGKLTGRQISAPGTAAACPPPEVPCSTTSSDPARSSTGPGSPAAWPTSGSATAGSSPSARSTRRGRPSSTPAGSS